MTSHELDHKSADVIPRFTTLNIRHSYISKLHMEEDSLTAALSDV